MHAHHPLPHRVLGVEEVAGEGGEEGARGEEAGQGLLEARDEEQGRHAVLVAEPRHPRHVAHRRLQRLAAPLEVRGTRALLDGIMALWHLG